ncbi:MAG: hypothetical protein ABR520_10895 [Mycobacteriales bacterium]|nr:hypothetical protein [Frankia sp.]
MGRVGRYTLSVMVWVAAYAGWSTILGAVIAGVTKKGPTLEVSTGTSALFTVLLPLVPTVAALWFNDWARDGFPAREPSRGGRRDEPDGRGEESADSTEVPLPPTVRVVAAAPLGVPERPEGGAAPHGDSYPVAPVLRD